MSHHRKTFDSHFNPNQRGVQYGVLRGTIIKFGTEDGTPTPHFQIIVQDNVPQTWRIAVNVRSDDGSNDQAIVLDPLTHPITTKLGAVAVGFTALPDHAAGGLALDFVRDPLFQEADMKILPPFGEDPSNDNEIGLEDILSKLTQSAIDEAGAGAEIYAWGSKFVVGSHPVAADTQYGDTMGVHDVHMNQGNPPPHDVDNGIYQDGGLVFHLTNPDRFVGVFMKFQSQTWSE